MGFKEQKEMAAAWRGPKSICACGHEGDGSDSEHASQLQGQCDGHGACLVAGCDCTQFVWTDFTDRFAQGLVEMEAKNR